MPRGEVDANMSAFVATTISAEIINGRSSDFVFQRNQNPSLKLVGVTGHWGLYAKAEDLEKEFGIPHQGFDRIWEYDSSISRDQAIEQEMEAVVTGIRLTAEMSGIPLGKVAFIGLGTGSPINNHYVEDIVQKAGLPRYCVPFESNTGCASAVRVWQRMNAVYKNDKKMKGWPALIVGVDGSKREILKRDRSKVTDNFTNAIISNGIAVFELFPEDDLVEVASVTDTKRDRRHGIAAIAPYPLDPRRALLQMWDNHERLIVPSPELEEALMTIIPRYTTEDLGPFGGHTLDKFMQQNGGKIDLILGHQPSKKMWEFFLRNAHIGSTPAPWSETEGNSSAATAIANVVRFMDQIKPGYRVIVTSFGAGYMITILLLEARGKN